MADNSQLGAPTGVGDTVRDKDRLGVKTQIVGLDLNIAGGETLMAGAMPSDLTTTAVADGGALPAKGVQVGGTDGSVFQVLSTDAAGRLNTNVNGTVPVSAASLPLPTGASTSAKQPALGTAGAASADVISVQGVASMTPVKTDGSGVTQPVSGTVTATLGATTNAGATAKTSDYDTGAGTDTVTSFGIALPASGGAVQGGTATAPVRTDPTGTTTQPVSGTVTATGPLTDAQLRASAPTVDTELPAAAALADAAANPTTPMVGSAGLVWNGATWDRLRGDTTNGAFVNVKTSVLPTGASTSAKQPTLGTAGTPSADVISIQGIASMTAVKVDPSAVTSPVSLASLPALATGSNLIGRVNVEPETTGGLSIFHLVSAATTNATNLKASAGQVYGWYIYNSNTIARKVAFHNTAGTPTAGASIAFAIVIPPTSAANVEFTTGIAFATGIGISTVTDLTDAGATAVAASDLIINIFFK